MLGISKVHGTLKVRNSYILQIFLQELQRENTFLRAQFAQKTEALSKEKIELEKKLSASEVEVQLIRESLRVALQKHSEEGKKMSQLHGAYSLDGVLRGRRGI